MILYMFLGLVVIGWIGWARCEFKRLSEHELFAAMARRHHAEIADARRQLKVRGAPAPCGCVDVPAQRVLCPADQALNDVETLWQP
jgi:hypothetical protein